MPNNVILDTNVIISALLKKGSVPHQVLTLCLEKAQISFSIQTFTELIAKVTLPKFNRYASVEYRQETLEILERRGRFFYPHARVSDCRDEDDNRFLELALAAGAKYLVTGDKDLLDLDPYQGIRILTPATFLAEIQK